MNKYITCTKGMKLINETSNGPEVDTVSKHNHNITFIEVRFIPKRCVLRLE